MRLTLSQPIVRSDNGRGSLDADRYRSAIRWALLVVMAIGCHRVESGANPTLALETQSAQEEFEASKTFEWPHDESHPILTLEITTGADAGNGTISIELMPELAPVTVARVVDLAKDGYYDGTTFHRVIPDFMIQGGDPNSRDRDPDNDGNGNPELRIRDEFGDAPFIRGVVGMGNKGRQNSTGGQFFIMQADNRSLDGRYTVIGRVVSGIEIVDAITTVSIDRVGRWGPKDRPIANVRMTRVAIEEVAAVDPVQTTGGRGDTAGATDADI
jgi:peptidyl-prolyl cis-trans isomerase B (cyclophilin B)